MNSRIILYFKKYIVYYVTDPDPYTSKICDTLLFAWTFACILNCNYKKNELYFINISNVFFFFRVVNN